ncbi:COG4223 family protein [Actibacterium mucosum]|uniref:COG4223 family protein n=1 Tax=Actibacterium mucosum TaxID=1087332 RepID=UPI001267EE18|nr:hypothetical protein [Actibacterium mucosum]
MTADTNPKENPEETPEILDSEAETGVESAEADGRAEGAVEVDESEPQEPAQDRDDADVTEDAAPTEPVATAEPVAPRRRGGFLGTVLGGVLAAGIGFAGAQYLGPLNLSGGDADNGLAEKLAAQDTRLAEMTQQLAALSAAPGDNEVSSAALDALATQLQEVNQDVSAQLKDITSATTNMAVALDGLEGRVSALEKRPVAETADLSGAVTAYENELARLRNQVQAMQNEAESSAIAFSQQADQAAARVKAANANAAKLESRAGLMQIRAAMDSGAPFADAVAAITIVDVPKPLQNLAAKGVPTMPELVEAFADPAREALAESRRVLAGGNAANRFGAFLQTQVGVRSTVPREGDSPDAILSRAEGAVRAGDLSLALTELKALPQEGQDAMQPWKRLVNQRRNALNAVTALGDALAQN